MSKRQITTGMRLIAKRMGIMPTDIGSIDIADASAIDRAIQRAATYAMHKERARIYDAVNERYKELAATNKSTTNMAQVLTFIDGTHSGAPTKGAVK